MTDFPEVILIMLLTLLTYGGIVCTLFIGAWIWVRCSKKYSVVDGLSITYLYGTPGYSIGVGNYRFFTVYPRYISTYELYTHGEPVPELSVEYLEQLSNVEILEILDAAHARHMEKKVEEKIAKAKLKTFKL